MCHCNERCLREDAAPNVKSLRQKDKENIERIKKLKPLRERYIKIIKEAHEKIKW